MSTDVNADGLNRRDWCSWSARGLGATAALMMLQRDGVIQAEETAATIHHPAKCRRVIQIYLCGGLSHLDSFD